MKVLIFGSSGFIGTHLTTHLRASGHDVMGYDRVSRPSTTFCGDIRDREAVHSAMLMCDRWINLAGLLGTSELVHRAQDAVDVNIGGALNVYEAARVTKRPGVQITVGNHWMNNAYSITKSAAERFGLMYQKDLVVDIRILRAMNVYGPGQKAAPVRKLIPNLIIPALRNEDITIYGSGAQVMDMLYVTDACEHLAKMALADGPIHGIVEVGSGRATTVNDILGIVMEVTGSRSRIERVPMRAGEEPLSTVLARGCNPADFVTLEYGISETAAAYRMELEIECTTA